MSSFFLVLCCYYSCLKFEIVLSFTYLSHICGFLGCLHTCIFTGFFLLRIFHIPFWIFEFHKKTALYIYIEIKNPFFQIFILKKAKWEVTQVGLLYQSLLTSTNFEVKMSLLLIFLLTLTIISQFRSASLGLYFFPFGSDIFQL